MPEKSGGAVLRINYGVGHSVVCHNSFFSDYGKLELRKGKLIGHFLHDLPSLRASLFAQARGIHAVAVD